MSSRFASAVLASLALAATASASTITVSKGGAISTIQAGVSAAGAGDTVLVKAGTYEEAVDVPAGKDGLTLKAKGKVILDARAPNGDGLGPAIDVQSANVSIIGLEIRNAGDDLVVIGDGIFFAGANLSVSKCRLIDCEGFAIRSLNGAGARVTDCTVIGCASGIFIQGAGVQVTKTKLQMSDVGIKIFGSDAVIRQCELRAINDQFVILEGDGARVERNTFTRGGGIGISIDGSNAVLTKNEISLVGLGALFIDGGGSNLGKNRITTCGGVAVTIINGAGSELAKNTISNCAQRAIQLGGDGSELTKNEISEAIGGGIGAAGSNITIERNKIRRTAAAGIALEGANSVIRDNELRDLTGQSDGIFLQNASGGTVADNRIENVGGNGVHLETTTAGIEITGNTVRAAGDFFADCGFNVSGANHTVAQNVARDGAGDGFQCHGDSLALSRNESTGNLRDGFQVVNGMNVTVDRNTAKGNTAEGIEINANGTSVTNNKATGNRIDFADSSTGSTFTGNTSGDGTDASPPPPEID